MNNPLVRAVGVSERDWHDQGQVLCHPIAKIVIVKEENLKVARYFLILHVQRIIFLVLTASNASLMVQGIAFHHITLCTFFSNLTEFHYLVF